MIEQQLSIFVENKPGVMADICEALAAQDINIRAMSVSDTVDHAVVRLVVDEPRKAIHLLGDRGVLVVETDVLAVKMPNDPGALAKAASKLALAGVNIEYAYGSGADDQCVIVIRVSDAEKAEQVLSTSNM